MRRLGIGFLFAVVGYLAGAFGGGLLITAFGEPKIDLQVEAAMTGAFVIGPLVAFVAFAVGAAWAGTKPPPRS
jgi:hypothetical protein